MKFHEFYGDIFPTIAPARFPPNILLEIHMFSSYPNTENPMKKKRRVAIHPRMSFALLVVISAILITSCTPPWETRPANLPTSAKASKAYEVQPGDRLFISVWREETLQREVVVRPDGGIRFPLAGEVEAAGLSLAEIEARLKKLLTTYIPDPAVSVSLMQSTGNRVYVVGRVNSPGEYALTRNIHVMQALALAGGTTPFAKKDSITILREENGAQKVYRFNYKEVEGGERLNQNFLLMPGDTVVVP